MYIESRPRATSELGTNRVGSPKHMLLYNTGGVSRNKEQSRHRGTMITQTSLDDIVWTIIFTLRSLIVQIIAGARLVVVLVVLLSRSEYNVFSA